MESGGQNIGVSASASLLPMNIQDWFPLGLTGFKEERKHDNFFFTVWKGKTNKQTGMAIPLSDKIDFMTKKVMRDKEELYITIKGSIH